MIKKYIFKFHPKINYGSVSQKIRNSNYINMEIGEKHISNYLSYVSELVVTYISVGYEAYLLGIPVSVICLPNKINESLLLDIYENEKPDLISIDWN